MNTKINIILLCCLLILSVKGKAQIGTIVLDSVMPPVTMLVVATESVVLKPGFHYKGNQGELRAKIDNYNALTPLVNLGEGSTVNTELSGENKNYIVTKTSLSSGNNPPTLNTVNYFDGLGRKEEQVQMGISPLGADMISLIEYDQASREQKQWLPAAIAGGFGQFIASPELQNHAANFYDDAYCYTETLYEPSALNRVATQWGPGAAWRTANRATHIEYLSNNSSNPVVHFKVNTNKDLVREGFYDPSKLYLTKTTNEENQEVYEYKDKQGLLLLSRLVANATNYDTYYVYDQSDLLCYVLSPEASSRITGDGTYSSQGINTIGNALDQYAFQYRYDNRNRCTKKKLPGSDWIYMIYDQCDRLVLSQDGSQRQLPYPQSNWSYIKYDPLGRVIESGVTLLSQSFNALQQYYKNISVVETYNTETSGYSCNHSFGLNDTALIRYYYDGYQLPSSFPAQLVYQETNGALSSFDARYDVGPSPAAGLLTGSEVSMLKDPNKKLYSVIYYDYKARPVQQLSTNHTGGIDYDFFAYNFTDQVLRQRHVHTAFEEDADYSSGPFYEDYHFTYDHAGRQLSCRYTLSNNDSILSSVNLNTMTYDELGRMQQKTIHQSVLSGSFTYNIRGWLTSIASPVFNEQIYYQEAQSGQTPYYNGNISSISWGFCGRTDKAYSFSYDQLNRLTEAVYSPDNRYNEKVEEYDLNGNIKSLSRSGYVHDGISMDPIKGLIDDLTLEYRGNRLVKVSDNVGEETVLTSNDFKDVSNVNISDEYLYDACGNTTADLNRGIAWVKYNCLHLPTTIQFSNGNKSSYAYDARGMKRSVQHAFSLSGIQIPFGADTVENTQSIQSFSQTDYCGNFIYEDAQLSRILTPEGYIETADSNGSIATAGNWRLTYFLKDHLGNVRARIAAPNFNSPVPSVPPSSPPSSPAYTLLDTTDYYPLGLEISTPEGLLTSGNNPYLYNGKELDRMHGLNMYDYGARFYDAALGRWYIVDRFAEKYTNLTLYHYAANNPILYIDINGDSIQATTEAIMAIYHALGENANVTFSVKDGKIDPNSFKEQAEKSDDIVLKDLYEIASNEQMVEIYVAGKYDYFDNNGEKHESDEPGNPRDMGTPYDYDTKDDPEIEASFKYFGLPIGKSINGNLGRTLFPGNYSLTGANSTNNNIQIILNGNGNLNHRAVGVAHEFGHVVLYLRKLPYRHGEKGVGRAIYIDREDVVKKRLGYDF
jgi:RHS repeat-associated protein